jgi:hypothetical protein
MGEGDLSADVCVVDEEDEDRFNAVTLTGTPRYGAMAAYWRHRRPIICSGLAAMVNGRK